MFLGIGNPRPISPWALNPEASAIFHNTKLRTLPPPVVYLTRGSNPKPLMVTQFGQIRQQSPIYRSCTPAGQIVRVNNKADEAIFLSNQIDLLFPKIQGMLMENMEQGIVLGCSNRQLEYVIDKIGQDRAASPPLWIQVGDIRHRHVIFKCQGPKPFMITV